MGNSECQTKSSIFVDGAAPVFTAHSTDWRKTCQGGRGVEKVAEERDAIPGIFIPLHQFTKIQHIFYAVA